MSAPIQTSPLWAITAYFNPLHYRRRLHNYRLFRRSLRVPLVAVELGYDGLFELQSGDAEILLQWPGRDVMWQKERLLNLALAAVPAEATRVVCLDCDILFERADWPVLTCRLLDEFPLVQPFSLASNLHVDHLPDDPGGAAVETSSPTVARLLQQGVRASDLCNVPWSDPQQGSPCCYGHAWAFRRQVVARGGFYDRCVVGGGDRAMCFASCGLFREIAESMHMSTRSQEHFFQWANPWHEAIQGRWGCVEGRLFHLWHGELIHRKYRQRYRDFAVFEFNPEQDIALDEHGCWRFHSDKPAMHAYLADYFASRQEDGTLSDLRCRQ
jgi:hypothetical protein